MTLIPTDLSASRITDAVRGPHREIAASSRVLDLSVGIVVCIPCFRRPQHLRLTLRSLADQRTQRSFAVVMVENDATGRESAPVAAPVAWDELDQYDSGHHFSIRDVDELLERASSKALAGWGKAKQALPNA